MSYILCLETATKICSVALFKEGELIDFKEVGGEYSHAENLAVFIEDVIQRNELEYSALKAIAVSKGPGSYTGLRIGVSLAKGLAFSLSIPLIAIDSLKSMAWGTVKEIDNKEAYYCPMIDARRMEVYNAIYNHQLSVIQDIAANVIDEDSFQDFFKENKVYFFGDGAEKCKETLNHSNAHFINILSSARYMGALAEKAFQNKEFEDLAYFEPFYLKDFVAQKPKDMV